MHISGGSKNKKARIWRETRCDVWFARAVVYCPMALYDGVAIIDEPLEAD